MSNSTLVACRNGRSTGFSPVRMRPDITADKTVHVEDIGAMADEAAGHDKRTVCAHRWHGETAASAASCSPRLAEVAVPALITSPLARDRLISANIDRSHCQRWHSGRAIQPDIFAPSPAFESAVDLPRRDRSGRRTTPSRVPSEAASASFPAASTRSSGSCLRDPRDVAARPVQAGDEAEPNRIGSVSNTIGTVETPPLPPPPPAYRVGEDPTDATRSRRRRQAVIWPPPRYSTLTLRPSTNAA